MSMPAIRFAVTTQARAAAPAPLPLPGKQAIERRLRDHHEVHVLADVLDDSVELVQQAHAGRAWTLREGELRRLLLAHGAGRVILGIAREHEAVDRQGI